MTSENSPFGDMERLTAAVGWSMTPPPPVVRQQVLSVFAEHHGVAARRQHVVAHRHVERELLVVRGDDDASHAVYASEVADVTLRIDDGVISGQVIPIVRPTPSAFAVTVIDGPARARSQEGDANGGFQLPRLVPGSYRLLLDNTHLEIEIEVEIEFEGSLS